LNVRKAAATPCPSGQATRRRVRFVCDRCGCPCLIDGAKAEMLRERGGPILCKTCLEVELAARAVARRERDFAAPQVVCEQCAAVFRVARERLGLLRSKGKPLLCRDCLDGQMRRWKAEQADWEAGHPAVCCPRCGRTFRMNGRKLEALRARGVSVLCMVCLGQQNKSTVGTTHFTGVPTCSPA
jgi:protein-arginine kinase activator protein McsA